MEPNIYLTVSSTPLSTRNLTLSTDSQQFETRQPDWEAKSLWKETLEAVLGTTDNILENSNFKTELCKQDVAFKSGRSRDLSTSQTWTVPQEQTQNPQLVIFHGKNQGPVSRKHLKSRSRLRSQIKNHTWSLQLSCTVKTCSRFYWKLFFGSAAKRTPRHYAPIFRPLPLYNNLN